MKLVQNNVLTHKDDYFVLQYNLVSLKKSWMDYRTNTNVFCITSNMLVTKIKDEAAMWCHYRAKALNNVM
jgi:hypothetical protein